MSSSGPANRDHEQAASQRAPARGPGKPIPPRTIVWHSTLEFLLTFVLLFGVVTFVRWVIGPSAVSRAVPQIHLQLLIIGSAVGLLVAGLILSPPGRASGGHMNPAISLAMWRFGVFPAAGVLPYTAAQLAGSVLGALAAGAVWGSAAARPPVSYAELQPAPSWGVGQLFGTEALSMFVIVLIIGLCLSVARLASAVPWIVGLLVGGAIAGLGTFSGGSDNPPGNSAPPSTPARPGSCGFTCSPPCSHPCWPQPYGGPSTRPARSRLTGFADPPPSHTARRNPCVAHTGRLWHRAVTSIRTGGIPGRAGRTNRAAAGSQSAVGLCCAASYHDAQRGSAKTAREPDPGAPAPGQEEV